MSESPQLVNATNHPQNVNMMSRNERGQTNNSSNFRFTRSPISVTNDHINGNDDYRPLSHRTDRHTCMPSNSDQSVSFFNGKKYILHLLDISFSYFVMSPFNVIFWSSTWFLVDQLDHYLSTSLDKFTFLPSTWLGFALMIAICVLTPILERYVVAECTITHCIVSRLLIHIYNVGFLSFIHGFWKFLSIYSLTLKMHVLNFLFVFVAAQSILCLLQCASASIGPPFNVSIDTRKEFYKIVYRWKQQPSLSAAYIADLVFSQVIILPLVIVSWFSQWECISFIPLNTSISTNFIILGAGYIMATFLHLFHYHAVKARSIFLCGFFIECAMLTLASTSGMCILWGGWNICNSHLMGTWKSASIWHFCVSFVMLCLQTASTVGSPGIIRDGAKSKIFNIEYFTNRKCMSGLRPRAASVQYADDSSDNDEPLLVDEVINFRNQSGDSMLQSVLR